MSDTGLNQVIPSVSHTVGNPEGIGRKVHGLPIWAWALLIVGGGLLLYYLYRKYAGGSSAASANGVGLAADTTGTSTDTGSGGSAGYSASGAPTTNQAYLAQAVSEYGNGANTPLSVQQALTDLFNGNTLTAAEQKIINQVEGGLGAPPEGTPAPVFAPPATVSTQPAPANSGSSTAAKPVTVVGYVKQPGIGTIYQLTSNGVLHGITNFATYSQLNPTHKVTTVSNLSQYKVGSNIS